MFRFSATDLGRLGGFAKAEFMAVAEKRQGEVTAMQNGIGPTNGTSEGFLLLDSHMSPIFVNHTAAQVLVYPQRPEMHKDLNGHLAEKIRSVLLSEHMLHGSTLVSRFQSGRRQYVCRSFSSEAPLNGGSQPYLAVIFERASTKPTSLCQLFEKFHLTAREQEVAQLLSQGLTSKEIGVRMQISPNTVKAFLRLIMVKMGVTTRSGVLGKALNTDQ
jgi:DNA-binding CsgD family transcriptional regulator